MDMDEYAEFESNVSKDDPEENAALAKQICDSTDMEWDEEMLEWGTDAISKLRRLAKHIKNETQALVQSLPEKDCSERMLTNMARTWAMTLTFEVHRFAAGCACTTMKHAGEAALLKDGFHSMIRAQRDIQTTMTTMNDPNAVTLKEFYKAMAAIVDKEDPGL